MARMVEKREKNKQQQHKSNLISIKMFRNKMNDSIYGGLFCGLNEIIHWHYSGEYRLRIETPKVHRVQMRNP